MSINHREFLKVSVMASTSVKPGEGKTFPGVTTPFGMMQLSPDTITGGYNAPACSYEHSTIEGFSFARMSGGWFGDFGNLQVIPTRGELKTVYGHPDRSDEGWRFPYQHTNEVAECGYYAATGSIQDPCRDDGGSESRDPAFHLSARRWYGAVGFGLLWQMKYRYHWNRVL